MFDRLSIRTKLIAMVAAPLAVIVGLAGLGYTQRSAESDATRADAARLQAVTSVQTLQHALQLESLYSVTYLAGPEDGSTEDLEAQRTAVDEAAAAVAEAMQPITDTSAVSGGRAAQRAVTQVANSLRPQVDARSLEWAWAENLFRNALAALPTLNERIVASIEDGDLAQGAAAVISLGEYTTTQARIGVLLAGAAAEGSFPIVDGGATDPDADTASGQSSRTLFVEAVDRAETQLAVVSAQAGSDIRAQLRNQMVGGDLTLYVETVSRVRGLAGDAAVEIEPAAWTPAVVATLDQLRDIGGTESGAVLDLASQRVSDSDRAARLFLAGAIVAVLAALALAVSVATSIARPILSLTSAADRVANEQLPKLVDALRNPDGEDLEHLRPDVGALEAHGGRELTKLAQSVNQIQEVAVNVATEQATMLRKGIGDMFINLARRNQGLLDRQLEFIDELEAQEDDPDQLEHLFKLDHMATRMRRNAESLLVLAGAEPGRRRGKPVPLTKVALAAVGEIEHFARIDLLDVDECEVVSAAAADLAHLLSELMENATQFSPPDSRVEVVGHGNNGGGYTISITDQGIGMSADQLADANQLLSRPPLLGLTLARTLGFIVVGRLATRHGIAVRLVPSPAGGVTSIVSIPSSILIAQIDTLDLSDGSRASSPSIAPAPSNGIDTPSSILPPFEYYSGPSDEPAFDAPATLADAVPSGSAFDAGLSAVRDDEPVGLRTPDLFAAPADDVVTMLPAARSGSPLFGSGPSESPAGPVGSNGLPSRSPGSTLGGSGLASSAVDATLDRGLNGSALGGGPLFGAPPAPAPSPPAPAAPAVDHSVDGAGGPIGGSALAGSPTDGGSALTGPPLGGSPLTAPSGAVAPPSDGPRLFGSSPRRPSETPTGAGGGTHLFRAPPEPPPAHPPTAEPTAAPGVDSRAPRPPAVPASSPLVAPESDLMAPRPPAAPAPVARVAPPAAPAPVARVAPPAAPAPLPGEPPAAPLATRAPTAPAALPGEPPAAPVAAPLTPAPTTAPAAVAEAPVAPAAGGDALPQRTSAGLVKRVPRRAGGNRAVPGADGPARATTGATTRSPDEVRHMLSRFHSGKQAAAGPAPASTENPIEETR